MNALSPEVAIAIQRLVVVYYHDGSSGHVAPEDEVGYSVSTVENRRLRVLIDMALEQETDAVKRSAKRRRPRADREKTS